MNGGSTMNGDERKPLPRRKLSPSMLALLWLLRVYVLIAVPLVVYAFVKALHK